MLAVERPCRRNRLLTQHAPLQVVFTYSVFTCVYLRRVWFEIIMGKRVAVCYDGTEE